MILTKLDGDARGGAALSIREVVGCPVAFASTGERVGDFEQFHPDRLAGRILGMGDLLSLAEKAEAAYEGTQAAEAADAAERVLAGELTLDDFAEQMRQMRKLGGLGDLLAHLPSAQAAQAAEAGVDERRLARMEAIICSMTPTERAQPAIIDGSRRRRIAVGSGTTASDRGRTAAQLHRRPQDDAQRSGCRGPPQGKGSEGAARAGAARASHRPAARDTGPPRICSINSRISSRRPGSPTDPTRDHLRPVPVRWPGRSAEERPPVVAPAPRSCRRTPDMERSRFHGRLYR